MTVKHFQVKLTLRISYCHSEYLKLPFKSSNFALWAYFGHVLTYNPEWPIILRWLSLRIRGSANKIVHIQYVPKTSVCNKKISRCSTFQNSIPEVGGNSKWFATQ